MLHELTREKVGGMEPIEGYCVCCAPIDFEDEYTDLMTWEEAMVYGVMES